MTLNSWRMVPPTQCRQGGEFRSLGRASIAFALLVGSGACDSVDRTTMVPPSDANQVYWSLDLNHHAITLSTTAPWNTMQLQAVPLTYEEDTLSVEGATITYASRDTNAVSVTPDGTVLAKTTTSGGTVAVIVRLTLGDITHADTALVKVENNPAPGTLQSFSIQPGPDDSAKTDLLDYNGTLSLAKFLDRPDQTGAQMDELLVYYRSLNELVAKVDRESGDVLGPYTFPIGDDRTIGDTKVIASGYAYGVSFTDTVVVTIGYPLYTYWTVKEQFRADGQGLESYIEGGGTRTLGVNGYIVMSNNASQPVELRFEDTTGLQLLNGACAGPSLELLFPPHENIPNNFPCDEIVLFTQPGTYRYRDLRSGMSGVFVIY